MLNDKLSWKLIFLYFLNNNDSSIIEILNDNLFAGKYDINQEICFTSETIDLEVSWHPQPELKITFVVWIK